MPNSNARIEARQREAVCQDKVLRAALSLASESFAHAADPGWQAEMYEDQLRDAVIGYAEAITLRREKEKNDNPNQLTIEEGG